MRVRLGAPLDFQRYPTGGRVKKVFYWHGRVVGDHDVSGYRVNSEIDDLAWVPLEEAATRLSYTIDQQTLVEALATEWRTRTLVVVRHSPARSRKAWRKDDRLRPLLATGPAAGPAGCHRSWRRTARPAWSPPAARAACRRSRRTPRSADGRSGPTDALSEEDSTAGAVVEIVEDLLDGRECAVVCTHRPVLPAVLDTVGIVTDKLAPGAAGGRPPPQGQDRGFRALLSRFRPGWATDLSAACRHREKRRPTSSPRSPGVHHRPRIRTPLLPTFQGVRAVPGDRRATTRTQETQK